MFLSSLLSRSAEVALFSASTALLLAFSTGAASAANCNQQWSAGSVYTGGQVASQNSVNYTAAYWTQGDSPASNNGPSGSGKPWVSNGTCGSGAPAPTPVTPAPAPTPTPAPSPAPTNPAPNPTAPAARLFAPYVDMGTDFGQDVEAQVQAAGLKAVTMAFLVGPSDGSCSIAWGGYAGDSPRKLPNDQLWNGNYVQTIVQNLQSRGVKVVVSLGGASAPDPAYNCSNRGNSVADLQAVYQSVINRYHVTMLDFDVEAVYWPSEYHPETDTNSLHLRNQALVRLKAANPNLVISYTTAVEVSGLSDAGKNIVQLAKNDGLALDVLNIMAMDYGRGNDDNGNLGQAAVDAATHTKANLNSIGMSNTTIGIIPMIGANDVQDGYTAYFQLRDIETVQAFVTGAGAGYISRIGMWSLNRDNDCSTNANPATYSCSGVSQARWAFSSGFSQMQ